MGKSLDTYLCELLAYAQHRFGPRDPSYRIAVETAESAPQIHFHFPGPQQILIQVHPECEKDMGCALIEIGHEVVHCLGPTPDFSTFLEEGTASVCALDSAARCGCFRLSPKPPDPYWRPEWLVRKLLERNPDVIKTIRRTEPLLSAVSADLILQVSPRFDPRFAQELTTRFWSRNDAQK